MQEVSAAAPYCANWGVRGSRTEADHCGAATCPTTSCIYASPQRHSSYRPHFPLAIYIFCISLRLCYISPSRCPFLCKRSSARILTMSNYESTRDSAAQKTEEAKNVGQQKAGEAQQATKVSSSCHYLWKYTSCFVDFKGSNCQD